MTAQDSIGIGIVGLGYGATRCELLPGTPGAHLAYVCDRDEDRARRIGTSLGVPWTTDHRRLLESREVDVVGVYTPSGLHLDTVLDVAAAGKHVLVTKPAEVTLERIDQMLAACSAAGVELFVEYFSRYHPDVYRLRRAIENGQLGELILGEFKWKGYRPDRYYNADGGWRRARELNGGGVLMNQTMHAIDELLWCMGEVESVFALTDTYSHAIDVEDTAVALLRLRSGATATLVGTSTFMTSRAPDFDYGGGSTTGVEINGKRGSVSIVNEELADCRLEEGDLADASDMPPNVFADIAGALTRPDYRSLTLARGTEARRAVEVAMAIYESAATQRPVTLRATA
jgi:UDP-N-acetyl-2-amino-2-deoxyglucuronate dehydrogenase